MSAVAFQPSALHDVMSETAVNATGLGKTLDDRVILEDLSFAIDPGDFVALLGANGAGKTTLLRVIATLLPPSSGVLTLFGSDIRRNATEVRARIGLIGHNAMLYRDLSLMENLLFFGRLYGLANVRNRAMELLEYAELSTRADDPVKTFSRGMLQRAAIARALMHDPELLLADEPFTGLDAPSRDTLERMLRQMHAESRTIVITNHDIGQSLELTQRTMVLRRGRLILDQRSDELSAASVLKEVKAS